MGLVDGSPAVWLRAPAVIPTTHRTQNHSTSRRSLVKAYDFPTRICPSPFFFFFFFPRAIWLVAVLTTCLIDSSELPAAVDWGVASAAFSTS